MTTYRLEYGTLEVTGRMYSGTLRIDTYTPYDQTQAPVRHTTHVTDCHDNSNVAVFYPPGNPHGVSNYRNYHGNCAGCYLGLAHSVDLHDAEAKGNW